MRLQVQIPHHVPITPALFGVTQQNNGRVTVQGTQWPSEAYKHSPHMCTYIIHTKAKDVDKYTKQHYLFLQNLNFLPIVFTLAHNLSSPKFKAETTFRII